MKRSSLILLLLTCQVAVALSQLRLVSVEQLPLRLGSDWTQPRFAPDGGSILFTTSSFNGIWQYSLADRTTKQLTADPGSGSAFAISQDGRQLAYRRTTYSSVTPDRLQEIVLKDLGNQSTSVVAAAQSLSAPVFADGDVAYAEKTPPAVTLKKSAPSVSLLGIENSRIALNRDGKKVLLDPFGNGSYIWPSLSPQGDRIVAYELGQGTFVCDLDGNVTVRLGRLDGAVWTRDGQWLIYMDDKDDGHRILSSDIKFKSADGTMSGALTATSDLFEMYPSCSPVDNRIVCSSLSGKIFLLTYEEVKP